MEEERLHQEAQLEVEMNEDEVTTPAHTSTHSPWIEFSWFKFSNWPLLPPNSQTTATFPPHPPPASLPGADAAGQGEGGA